MAEENGQQVLELIKLQQELLEYEFKISRLNRMIIATLVALILTWITIAYIILR